MKKIEFEKHLRKITFIFYLILILSIVNVALIFVRLGGYLPDNTLEAHKYIGGIVFVISAIFLAFEFYLGHSKGIFINGKVFIIDKTKIGSSWFLGDILACILSFLTGLAMLIFL